MIRSVVELQAFLAQGRVIPACPLALTKERRLDERQQRALLRYYCAAGAGGLAVGVHTTQFAIHNDKVGLYRPVLELAAEELNRYSPEMVQVAGIVGKTDQAIREALLAKSFGYQAGLLSLSAYVGASEDEMLSHCRTLAEVIPLFGFYLQPAAGGRLLSYRFWRRFCEIESVVAIKIAPFNRYQTLDVIRAVLDSKRPDDIALYTGNDDHIVGDLLTTFRFGDETQPTLAFAGGLLGHWAVWTRSAVEILRTCRRARLGGSIPAELLTLDAQVTEMNAALFDAANSYAGCIAGIHEVLARQGLLAGRWTLDPNEDLSPGQKDEIERVMKLYPKLVDDTFVRAHLDEWLR
jgi:dihydrodipicolinate synthase/N-acetylneuraminate lyase